MVGSRYTTTFTVAAVLACALAVTAVGAGAETRLVLPAASLPGLRPAPAVPRVAQADLAARLSAQLTGVVDGALAQTATGTGSGQVVRSDAFVFGSASTASRVLAAWQAARHGSREPVGHPGYIARRGRTLSVAWREGNRIGVIVLTVKRRAARDRALQYAALADGWLTAPVPSTAWGSVLAQIRPNGTVSKTTALEAFVLAYGPLPGVATPPGRRTGIPSGTLAAQWVVRYLPQLSRRQRAIVERRLGLPPPTRVARAAFVDDPTFHQDVEIQALADDWLPTYQSLTGHTLKMKVIGGLTSEVVKGKNGGLAYADTWPFNAEGGWDSGQMVTCRIRVTAVGQAQSSEFLKLVVAHELFHCFEFDMVGSWNLPADWITEGMADWAALSVDPVPWTVGGGNLNTYLFSPKTPLFERSYDAVGFWGHVEDVFPGLFKRAASVLNAGSNQASFSAALAGTDDAFLSSWGSSPFRASTAGGPAWQMHSPIEPPAFGALPLAYETIDPAILGGNGTVDAPPLTTAQYIVISPPDEPVLHVVIQGHARLGLEENYTDLKDVWFCTSPGDCFCPANTTGSVPPTLPLTSKAALGLSGDPDAPGTYGGLTSYPLSQFCHPKQPQPSPGQGGNRGVSNGDPYITTFDGGGYGFQAAGEFTLVKSLTDNLEIQSRQVPYPSTLFPEFAHSLAMNTAFAMRVGGAIVEIDRGSPLVLYVNHRRRFAANGRTIALPGGGRVRYGSTETTITWSDGTRALVNSIGEEGVNIAVTPSADRAGLLRGLLGADDGHIDDDFIGRNGRRYDAKQIQSVGLAAITPAQVRVVLGAFGRSWRITQRESLLVYPPGKHTRSYLVPGFPRALISLGSLSRRRRTIAAGVCRRAGVSNATLLVGCEIDYGATGDHVLASSTGSLQHDAGIKGSGTTGGGSGISTSPVGWTQLSEQLDTSYGQPSIALAGGQVVAIAHRQSDQALETDAFTPGASGVSGLARATPFTGWISTLNPVLLPAAGGGLQAIIAGQHSGDSTDTLNGTSLVPRGADGSFGFPAQLDSMLGYGATSAILAADGSTPLWASGGGFGDQLLVFSGSTQHDLTADSPGFTANPTIARDRTGRVWLAWSVFSESAGVSGLYMMQLDPQTGAALGPAMEAPNSAGDGSGGLTVSIVCGQGCRLLYVNPAGPEGEQILSWAPGESDATPVVAGLIEGHQQALGRVAGAYTQDGRLWITWDDDSPGTPYAKLGNETGGGGTVIQLPKPPALVRNGFDAPAVTDAITVGNRLVLVTLWNDGLTSNSTSVWGTVVNPG